MDGKRVRVIGGGLAGSEAAYQLANAGFQVELYEMKPDKRTPAQVSDHLAELVCSNSFRSNNPIHAVGLLKEEMRRLGGLIIRCADKTRVPAGGALAVDRKVFSGLVEAELTGHPGIQIIRQEVVQLWEDNIATVVATGPLTSELLSRDIASRIGMEQLSFYDAIAPIIEADSIDITSAFFASRWENEDNKDYINCPLSKEEYDRFYNALVRADLAADKPFEKIHYFEGCLPIEELARRGPKTLLFGPLKPVGLVDPRTEKRPYAVLQLRKENIFGTAYNLVGCQTRLRQPAQKQVFGLVPALRNARFFRYGAIHRNTYLNAPKVLDEFLGLRTNNGKSKNPANAYFAGQITGVEGYVESTACGLIVALFLSEILKGKTPTMPPLGTALGGLYHHTRATLNNSDHYVPSNMTWAMFPPHEELRGRVGRKEKREHMAERAFMKLEQWFHSLCRN